MDGLNKKLIYDISGWDILHVVFFFSLCFTVGVGFNLYAHFVIFMIGVIWFFNEKYLLSSLNDNITCERNDIVYKNIYEPKISDLLFNTFGQLLYIISLTLMNVLRKKIQQYM